MVRKNSTPTSTNTPERETFAMETQDECVGLSNPTLSQGRRKMLDMVNRLHSTGVQVDIDLPQIAVIGSQSAGKSSLIESISGITLPRASGTCTRCPTECRMSRSQEPWKCIVSLRFTTDDEGQALGQPRNETFGEVIYNKDEVEDRIKRAQVAILNPKKPVQEFLDADLSEDHPAELGFSSNMVSLNISGPDVADLSFVDLPGLIASVTSGNSKSNGDITLIQNLITTYIKRPNCIILLTVTCETDFENQGAYNLTKQYDPLGKRTVGVLTKPDRIPKGEEGGWLPFIRNEKEPLENGWFCVKQPSSHDLKNKMTWDSARRKENTFFSATSPWCELDPQYQTQLRTENLVEKLSAILSDLVLKRMPEISKEIDASIQSCKTSLSLLPQPPPANPQSEIASMLFNFVSDLSLHVEGVPDEDGLMQAIRPAQERFRRAIRATAPNFRPFENKYKDKQHIRRAKFLVSEDGESPLDDEESCNEDDSENDSLRNKGNDIDDDSPDSEVASQKVVPPSSSRKRKEHPTNKIYIDEVLDRANRARTRELPGNFPYVVQETFIESFIREWKMPALELCETIYRHIQHHVQKLVSKHFKDFGRGLLERRLKKIMDKYVEECRATTESQVLWLLGLEGAPFSLNTHYLSAYQSKFITYYRAERQRYDKYKSKLASSDPSNQALVKKTLGCLAELGVTGVQWFDLQKLIPADDMEPALHIMADVRAYFQVAYKRFTDIIPLSIDHELMRMMAKNAMKTISEELGTNSMDGHQISEDLAQECPQVFIRRAELSKKLRRLERAKKNISRLEPVS